VFSFVEILLATIVLALSATATAYWMETTTNLTRDADEQTIGAALVKIVETMASSKAFSEPGSTNFGPESGETLTGFDDLDDFHGLVADPPFDADGKTMPEFAGWRVSCTVANFDPEAAEGSGEASPRTGDTGVRSLTVVVDRAGREVARAFLVRARSASE
jgi:hypothetical protein